MCDETSNAILSKLVVKNLTTKNVEWLKQLAEEHGRDRVLVHIISQERCPSVEIMRWIAEEPNVKPEKLVSWFLNACKSIDLQKAQFLAHELDVHPELILPHFNGRMRSYIISSKNIRFIEWFFDFLCLSPLDGLDSDTSNCRF